MAHCNVSLTSEPIGASDRVSMELVADVLALGQHLVRRKLVRLLPLLRQMLANLVVLDVRMRMPHNWHQSVVISWINRLLLQTVVVHGEREEAIFWASLDDRHQRLLVQRGERLVL